MKKITFTLLALVVTCFMWQGNAQTFTAADTPQTVGPDAGTVTSSIATSTAVGVVGLESGEFSLDNVSLNINHTWADDLDIRLTSPGGVTVDLSTDNGGSAGLDTAADLVFTDSSLNDVTTWGSFTPLADYKAEGGLLNVLFAGEPANGDWTLTVTDDTGGDGGNLNSYSITLSINRGTPPVIACPADVMINTTGGLCTGVPNWAAPIVFDVEDGPLTAMQIGGPMTGSPVAPGVYVVTYEATDSDGNIVSCSFNVTVADMEAPVAVCQDISLDLDAAGLVSITPADLDNGSSDNCGIVSSTLTTGVAASATLNTGFAANNAAAGNMFEIMAINPITINSFDISANVAAGESHNYEVYFKVGSWQGSQTTPGNWTLVASPTGIVNVGPGLATPLNLSLGIDVAAGELVAFYITATDGSTLGYTGSAGTTGVGNLWASDANIEFYEGAGKGYPFGSTFAPRVWNGNIQYETGQVPFSGTFDCSSIGANVVTVTHTDAAGNASSCTSIVTISDVTAPEIVCIGQPGNITDSTSDSPALGILDNTTVSATMTIADDFVITDLDVDLDITHTWVGDLQITLESPAGTQVLIFDGGSDGCSGDNIMDRYNDDSANALDCQAGADAFPLADYIPSNPLAAFNGESTLGDWTLFIEDTAGGDQGTLNTWTLNYGHDVSGSPLVLVLDANGMATINAGDLLFSVDEACGWTPIFAGTPPTTSSLTTTFAGGNGQSGNMFDIMAINDLTVDSFDISFDSGVTDDVEIYTKTGTWVGFDADPAAWTLLTTVTGVTSAGDNVPTPLNLNLGVDVLAGETVAFYVTLTTTTAINYTNGTVVGALFASDANMEFYEGSGNPYPFAGTFAPRIFNGNIVYSTGTGSSTSLDFDCSMLGENLIEVTVVDDSGNTASCMATVTVLDLTAPVLVCTDVTLELGPDGTATVDPMTLVDSSSFDACGITSYGVNITEVNCDDLGTPVTIVVFVSDSSGNPSTCTATVTVVDALAPIVTCPANQTVDPGAGNLFYEVPDYIGTGEATADDNCTDPVTITTQDPAAGSLISDGTYTVTITGEDASGNVGTCSFQLTVESVLGIESNELNNAISMYPNPAQDRVTISNSSNIQLETAVIFDLNGKMINQIDLSTMQGEQVINISDLASGVYMIQLTSDTSSTIKRLVKE
jgi:subtilisin-like proprotein convertase family protein